jgi:hypothetical protein
MSIFGIPKTEFPIVCKFYVECKCMFLVISQIDWPKLHEACIVWAHAELQASLDISKPNFSTGTD